MRSIIRVHLWAQRTFSKCILSGPGHAMSFSYTSKLKIFYTRNGWSRQKREFSNKSDRMNTFAACQNVSNLTDDGLTVGQTTQKSDETYLWLAKWPRILYIIYIIMSNFTFGHNVFKSRLLLLRQNASAGGEESTPICLIVCGTVLKPLTILSIFQQ